MNPKIALSLALMAAICNVSQAIFFGGLGVATAAGATTITIGSGAGAALALGGLGLLKAAAVIKGAAILSSRRRGRRSVGGVTEEDSAFLAAEVFEPEQCYHRLICDMSTGALARSENDVILSLFDRDFQAGQPGFSFKQASALGKQIRDIRSCEVTYSCRVSGAELARLFN